MPDVVIKAENLSKKYTIRRNRQDAGLRHVIHELATAPWRWLRPQGHQPEKKQSSKIEQFFALENVSFEVRRGEMLGIVGNNGAGKSTLLKVLSRITEPTGGSVRIKGRVASLLEVGTGFHPELSGRENIFLNGAILGMTRQEVKNKLDEIVSFADVENFLDTPIKRYSSGMYVRLAFAVAAHLEPEILVVDEVLAVGDGRFQKKCLGKMGDVARSGRTVIFVSHNMSAIRSLTGSCIWLADGKVNLQGHTEEVVEQYSAAMTGRIDGARPQLDAYHRDSIDESPVRIADIWIDDSSCHIPTIELGKDIAISIEIETSIQIKGAAIVFILKRADANIVTSVVSSDQGFNLSAPAGTHIITCKIQNLPLSPGDYLLNVWINQTADSLTWWDVILDYPILSVRENPSGIVWWPGRPWGAVHWDRISWACRSKPARV